MNLARYNKLWVALSVAAAVTGAALVDGNISNAELFQVAAAFLGSFGVYQAKNED